MQIGSRVVRHGITLMAVLAVLDGTAAVAQSLAVGEKASPPRSAPAGSPAGKLSSGRLEQGAEAPQQARATYFDRWGLHLALGGASFWERPAPQPTVAAFLSAGLHLGRSLAVVTEMGRGWWASGRLETPGGVSAACPDIDAGFHTFMAGVQYRHRVRRNTRFVQILAGRALYAGTAKEANNGVSSICRDAVSSGLALAAGGGVDFHLSDRLALRIAADFRRLAIPSLDGIERVFMADDADRHLGTMRVAVGFVLAI